MMLINPYRFASGGDPYFANVALLLKGDGTNGSTSIVDSSKLANVPTVVGNTQISTAQSRFDGSSIAFDGSGDRLVYASSSTWNFSVAPTTFEFFLRLNALPSGAACRIAMAGLNDVTSSFNVAQVSTSGQMLCGVPRTGFSALTHPTALQINIWYHYAVVLNGANTKMFINGVGATGNVTMPTSANNQFFIGFDTASTVNASFNGYLDEFRITKGIARYSGNFTPPAAPFPSF